MKTDLRKRPIYMKRDLWTRPIHTNKDLWKRPIKETYSYEKRPIEETYIYDKRPINETYARNFCLMLPRHGSAEVRMCQKRPMSMKRNLWTRPMHGTVVWCSLATAALRYDKCVKRDQHIWRKTHVYEKRPTNETYTQYFWVMLPRHMGWLRLVGSLKSQVSFAKETYKRDDILQKRPIILRSLLIVATP